MSRSAAVILIACAMLWALPERAVAEDEYAPHTPTLLFQLTGPLTTADAEALAAALKKLPSVHKAIVDPEKLTAQVRFDSHVVSFHQVAVAILQTRPACDPTLRFTVAAYPLADNAGKLDALFAGKRLNDRVRVEPIDKKTGVFLLHFKPLTIDPADKKPQGFNGGHLNHPVHDPPPRGLGLELVYESGNISP